MGQNVELLAPALGSNGPGRALEGELSYANWPSTYTPAIPSERTRVQELIRRRLKRVVTGQFINRLCRIDELWDRWRSLPDYAKAPSDQKVRDALRLHDVLD